MATIDKLMQGKTPGEIRIRQSYWGIGWFQPFFKISEGAWHGLRESGEGEIWDSSKDGWSPYTEPPKRVKRVYYQWVMRHPEGHMIVRDELFLDGKRPEYQTTIWTFVCRAEHTRIEIEEEGT